MSPADYQIAIVGGGPGGLAAALAAIEDGAESVCVIERRKRWGVPVQCGEFVPKMLARLVPIPSECVAQRVEQIRLFHCGDLVRTVRAPGFILHRDRWEAFLAERAEAKGVTMKQHAVVVQVGGGGVTLRHEGIERQVAAEVIIGADGPRSLVRSAAGAAHPALAHGLQHELRLATPLTTADLYFEPRFGAGYAWCFPKDEVANVGLALDDALRHETGPWLAELASHLKACDVLSTGQPVRRTGGRIPVGPPVRSTAAGNLLLVGDAAGQTNPLTGAGIYPAVACGRIAGRAAARAVKDAKTEHLRTYERRWQALFSDYLGLALSARERLATCSTDEHLSAVLSGWRL